MRTGWRLGAALAAALGVIGPGATAGQVIERDTKITGPRGRSIERDVRVERHPGVVERDIRIQRPGGTFERHSEVVGPRAAGFGPGYRPGPGPGFRPGPRIIERDVIINNRGGGAGIGEVLGVGLAAGALGLGLGVLASQPPPPPVYFAPPPVFYGPPVIVEPAPPPVVVYQPPVRYAPAPPPARIVYDPVADNLGRLKSRHANSRRDGALALGRLGDARAVGPLAERLVDDFEREVRVAAAWALGEIGDPRAAIALQRAALNDRRHDVREAAQVAYKKLPSDDAPPPSATTDSLPEAMVRPSQSRPIVADPTPPPLPEPPLGQPR